MNERMGEMMKDDIPASLTNPGFSTPFSLTNPAFSATENVSFPVWSHCMDEESEDKDYSPKIHQSTFLSPIIKSLPYDVQEEIECLYEFVPEVDHHFVVLDKIGEGTFSSVFLAQLKHYKELPQKFALKHIIPTSHPCRIEGELRCLQEIGGCDNVMGVELCIRHRDHVVIVMPYFPHKKFQDYVLTLSVNDVREYMRNLLIALRRVHQFDVIHRDVKPSNFLYNSATKQYALVDFGLAHKVKSQPNEMKLKNLKADNTSSVKSTKNPLSPSSSTQQNKQKTTACKKSQSYVTPELENSTFARRVKSPRRVLLAKRALMAKSKSSDHEKGAKPSAVLSTCDCFGKPQICSICNARMNQQAPRAGTPGFRAPEVLMKFPDQTTAVDIWSAGVIFLSLLSGRYPFFRANDDMTALAQIISIMGSEEVHESAKTYGKHLLCHPGNKPVDLKVLCTKLRAGPAAKHHCSQRDSISDKENAALASWSNVPDSAFDILRKLLDMNPYTRISADQALQHEFFSSLS
ncbi:cell division cycle 7-related protein kinase-like [Ostrea edulis]|uniref:cell division cycle 7-related protein kinase-like n=1 Tax=Ostrea edulis TaxID=37623 RepID=UPI0020953A6C|nr:cell division cycle 7-related protein kinase-like [Ostrea edulis]